MYVHLLKSSTNMQYNTSCTGEGEVSLCVFRGQGIMEIRDLL